MTNLGKKIMWVVVILVAALAIYLLQKPSVTVAPVDEVLVDENLPNYEYSNEILGKKEDLISFTILPGTQMPKGILSYRGSIKGAWFFEANILINILDANKQVLKASNAVATSEWMTVDPVDFEGNIDFTGLPAGPAYFEIHNDNASGLPENDKFIQIPIIIQ